MAKFTIGARRMPREMKPRMAAMPAEKAMPAMPMKTTSKFATMGRPPGREMTMGRAHQFGGWKAHNE
jgi:hypothetical protein